MIKSIYLSIFYIFFLAPTISGATEKCDFWTSSDVHVEKTRAYYKKSSYKEPNGDCDFIYNSSSVKECRDYAVDNDYDCYQLSTSKVKFRSTYGPGNFDRKFKSCYACIK